ncbi:hypothetical protein ACFXPS_25875 [Nocardia sp. NPDC059091]|uniref:hypothetical protein n=1 Tax=unclassified Nocardia TaxID=2637762 RepID=UPI0036B53CEB
MAAQPESSTFIGPTQLPRSGHWKAPHARHGLISSGTVDRLGEQAAAVNEQSGEKIAGRWEFSEPAAVWPDPSPLDEWWKTVMLGCDRARAAVPPSASGTSAVKSPDRGGRGR